MYSTHQSHPDGAFYEYLNQSRPQALNEPVEIDEGIYWYFLEMLPPLYCQHGFMICEADSSTSEGTIRSKFTQRANRYYHEWVCVPYPSPTSDPTTAEAPMLSEG